MADKLEPSGEGGATTQTVASARIPSVAMALAESTHHIAPRGQQKAE